MIPVMALPALIISTRTPFHREGGKGTTSEAIQFQLRPHPLVR